MMCRLFVIITLMIASFTVSAEAFTVNLKNVKLSDLAQVVYGDILKNSYTLHPDFLLELAEVSVNWQNLNASQVDQLTRDLIRSKGFEVIQANNLLTVRKSATSDDDLMIYQVQNRSAKYLADMISKVMQKQQLGGRNLPAPSGAQSPVVPEASGSAASNFDRSALDQLAYACRPVECARLRKLLVQLDTPEANVMLRAVIYEVATTNNEGSAMQILANMARGNRLVGVSLGSTLAGASTLTIGAGGFNAIISALDTDSRFKSLSRPSLRVKTGGMAKFSVGSQVPILGSVSQDRNGNAVQAVDYRPSGTIFTVTPDVRGEIIDLTVTQELSSFAVTSIGVTNSPTLLQRLATSSLTLHDSEVIVFAGLEEEKDDLAESKFLGLFPLSKKTTKAKSEILLFIEAQKI